MALEPAPRVRQGFCRNNTTRTSRLRTCRRFSRQGPQEHGGMTNTLSIDPRLTAIAASQPYPLLFMTISGAHLYGFPSPDSDYDLRGVHVLPASGVVGLIEQPE